MPCIRQAESKDIADIEYICRMTAGPKSRADEAIGRRISLTYSSYYARAEQATSFVIDDNGKIGGYVICAPSFKKYTKGYRKNEVKKLWALDKKSAITAYLLPLGYLPFYKKYPAHLHIDLLDEYQNQGYGTELIKALTNKLQSMDIHGLMLIVDEENTGAQRFYKRLDFKEIASAFGGVVMAKKL